MIPLNILKRKTIKAAVAVKVLISLYHNMHIVHALAISKDIMIALPL